MLCVSIHFSIQIPFEKSKADSLIYTNSQVYVSIFHWLCMHFSYDSIYYSQCKKIRTLTKPNEDYQCKLFG